MKKYVMPFTKVMNVNAKGAIMETNIAETSEVSDDVEVSEVPMF